MARTAGRGGRSPARRPASRAIGRGSARRTGSRAPFKVSSKSGVRQGLSPRARRPCRGQRFLQRWPSTWSQPERLEGLQAGGSAHLENKPGRCRSSPRSCRGAGRSPDRPGAAPPPALPSPRHPGSNPAKAGRKGLALSPRIVIHARPALESVQHQLLPERPGGRGRPAAAPFLVMVSGLERVGSGPRAAAPWNIPSHFPVFQAPVRGHWCQVPEEATLSPDRCHDPHFDQDPRGP